MIKIEPLEKEGDIIKEMCDLIEAFKVPTPPEDLAVFQTLYPSIDRAKNAIDKAIAEHDGNIDKFCAVLDKDIAELLRDVHEAKQAIHVSNSVAFTGLRRMDALFPTFPMV
ncbi:unnamed protein product [Protopolystoma xenopodis]|uniref:Uncharacterized protein n=1 Tax=Protopolystoma xenopodis TaxID=117903 RepID=A0A448WH76_9PLAT|nr:unnamed protein product [Protopolystoma xenopodis]